mmetsp:Transcript_88075/g.238625  ORF Transcript_88075/g.238625 Transcript_88075/m.238625 type:complete len:104 (-) Transcript_88075:78-389(-)
MVAFWRDVAVRPFGPDGLPGSSRPLPPTSEPFVAGGRSYTWHQQLQLDEATADAVRSASELPASGEAVVPIELPCIWEQVSDEGATPSGVTEEIPEYSSCFQF